MSKGIYKRKPFTEEHKRRIGIIRKGKKRLNTSGQNHWNYKNGLSHSKAQRVVYQQNRKAKKQENGGYYTLSEWETLKAQYNWTCPSCKKSESEMVLSVDHIIPISKGGSNNIENIQPLCLNCNTKKHTKIIKYEHHSLVEKLLAKIVSKEL